MNFIKHIFKKHLISILSIGFLIVFATTFHMLANGNPWPYAPGVTLNPGCLPTDPTCIVTIPSDYWSLTGDAGTIDGTNFIGTTDNIPLNFKVNNEKAGRIDNTLENTFYGYQSGYSDTTGKNNTAIGSSSLYSNLTGDYNTAIGDYALHDNTTGSYNIALGHRAFYANTTGSSNTVIGNGADTTAGTETNSIALGRGAMIDDSNQIVFGQTGIPVNNWKIAGVDYIMPVADGAGALTSDGSGNLSWTPASGASYQVYTALLTQTGTGETCVGDPNPCAPVATVLNSGDDNYLGDIVWSYNNAGQYFATLAGAFPQDTTFMIIGNDNSGLSANHPPYLGWYDVNSLLLEVAFDDYLTYTSIEIRVYPTPG